MMLLSRLAWLCLALVLACTSASAQYLSEIFADSVVSTNWEIFGGSSTEDAVGNTYQVFMFPSGSTVTVGEITLVNQGGFDTALVKIDPLGNIDWVRALQSPGNEEFFQVTTDPAGNVYVVGFTDTAQAGITINYSWDGILVKYDTNGNLQWITNKFSAQYFGSQQDAIMTVLYANNMLYFVQVSTALHVQVFQTDLNGNVQWTYTLPLVNAYYFTAFQLAVDPLRNQIYVAGQFYGQWSSSISNGKTVTGFSSQSWDGFLFAISTSGFPQWVIPQATPNNDYSQSVVLDSAGYVYVGSCIASSIDGQTYSSGGCNPLVIKYDWQGNRQWTRIYSQFPNMLTASLVMDNTGAFYARVTDGNSQNIIKSDTNGNVIWTQSLPGATGTTRDCGWNLPSGWCRGGSNAYLDGTAAFTLSGVYSGNFFGWASNQWVPYVSKWQLNVTCTSCTQFDTVLAELQTLLNVVVN